MTDNTDNKDDKKTLTLGGGGGRGTLSVRRPVEGGSRVKQSFSGGVTKSVAVEVARRRVLKPGETVESTAPTTPVSDVEARRMEALKNLGKEPPKRTLAFTAESVIAQEKAKKEEAKKMMTPEELRARELAEMEEIQASDNAKRSESEKAFQSERKPATTTSNTPNFARPGTMSTLR